MKRKIGLIIVFAILFCNFVFSQIPESFNYQAVLRNNSGELLKDQSVTIQISIINGSSSGSTIYREQHSKTTNNFGMIDLKIGTGTSNLGSFSDIVWSTLSKFIKIEVNTGTGFIDLGTSQILSVPYALYSKTAENIDKDVLYFTDTDTLFAVKDREGNVVFVVFPDGAKVITNPNAKGSVGGFAVSGRTPAKQEEDYFQITPDSTRFYINEISEKGSVGGFAVSGRTPAKSTLNDYLIVTSDSTRIYVNDTSTTKGTVGGFAVSGRTPAKGESQKFLDLTKANYFIGHEAGKSNTDGLYNSFIGYKSGYSNTIGERNVFLGYYSGFSNIDGAGNLFIGDSSGYSNIDGFYNIYLGNLSGKYNTSGFQNIGIGVKAGYKNSTGNRNVFIGTLTGQENTEGEMNVFIGNAAGTFNTIGKSNVFIGRTSGYKNSSGEDNIMIGNAAGLENTTASNNIFMGNSAGNKNLTGSENIFIGKESGFSNTEGKLNVCIGYQSGYSLTTGNYNSYLGFWTGYHNTIGTFNTFIGAQAGMYNTESNNNTFIGSYAAADDTCGWDNTFVGGAAGRYSSGYNNTFLGSIAGESTLYSHDNVYVGFLTGRNNLYGNYNVFIGSATGYWTNGDNNLFIGRSAGEYAQGSNNILIGFRAGFYNNSSNKLFIENSDSDSTLALIWGDFNENILRFNGSVALGGLPIENTNLTINNDASKGAIAVKGIGDTYNYSQVNLYSNEGPISRLYEINHNKSNNFSIVYYDGTDWNTRFVINTQGDFTFNGNQTISSDSTFVNIYPNSGELGRKSTINLHGTFGTGTITDYGTRSLAQIQAGCNDNEAWGGAFLRILGITTDGGTPTEWMRINTENGNVGIGTDSPDEKLVVFNGSTTGKYTSSGWTHSSDLRLKENIKPISNVLSDINKLEAVQFNFINDQAKTPQLGFIAQDVEKIFPELVITDNSGFKSIAYDQFSPLLVKAINEQQTQIEILKTENNELKQKLNEIILLLTTEK